MPGEANEEGDQEPLVSSLLVKGSEHSVSSVLWEGGEHVADTPNHRNGGTRLQRVPGAIASRCSSPFPIAQGVGRGKDRHKLFWVAVVVRERSHRRASEKPLNVQR